MNIYLVRHGQTDLNEKQIIQGWTDSSLNEKGKEQAREISKELAGLAFDAVFSSDLKRAYETARIILENNKHADNTEIKTDKRLRERGLGRLEGESSRNINETVYYEDNDELGFEKMLDFDSRVADFLSEIKDNNKNWNNVLVVTHNGTINAFRRLVGESAAMASYENGAIVKLGLG